MLGTSCLCYNAEVCIKLMRTDMSHAHNMDPLYYAAQFTKLHVSLVELSQWLHADVCSSCINSGMPSLCCHRSSAKAAALCVFDTRAGLDMVQRYSIHHRSLYPIMTCARGNFLFTSHVGAPLAVWDKRCRVSLTVHVFVCLSIPLSVRLPALPACLSVCLTVPAHLPATPSIMYKVNAVSEQLHAVSWLCGLLGRLVIFTSHHVSFLQADESCCI